MFLKTSKWKQQELLDVFSLHLLYSDDYDPGDLFVSSEWHQNKIIMLYSVIRLVSLYGVNVSCTLIKTIQLVNRFGFIVIFIIFYSIIIVDWILFLLIISIIKYIIYNNYYTRNKHERTYNCDCYFLYLNIKML